MILIVVNCQKKVIEPEEESPQIVSGPEVTVILDSSAVVEWTTSLPTDSKVKYGTTTDYEFEVLDGESRINHSLTLTALIPATTYHYQVESYNFEKTKRVGSSDQTFTTTHNQFSLTMLGWESFELQDYAAAISYFTQAKSIADYTDAYNGLGWGYIRVDSIQNALLNFNSSITLDSLNIDAYAGRSSVNLYLNRYTSAINDANNVISYDEFYVFSHDTTISYKDIRLILAQSYFYTQQYERAQEQVDIIYPENGLNPNDPSTWVVNGITYSTYHETLINMIQYLWGKV